MGKPKGKVNPKLSLVQIKDAVAKELGRDVKFAPDAADASEAAAALAPGEVLMLENLRFHAEEEGKPVGIDKADPKYDEAKQEMKQRQKDFAKKLASYADVSALPTASMHRLPSLPTISTLAIRCSVSLWKRK